MEEKNQLSFKIRRSEKVIEWGTILMLIFAPLAFGAVETWAWSLISLGCLVIVLAVRYHRRWISLWDSGEYPPTLPVRRRAVFYLFSGFGLLLLFGAVLQMIPCPVSWLNALSPATARYWLLSGRVFAGGWATFSLYPALSAAGLIKLTAYILLFSALLNYRPASGSRKVFITRLAVAIIVTGFVISLIGILQKYSWGGKIYGLRTIRFGSPFGPFVNRNHFAGYIIMVIPLALGMLLSRPNRSSETQRGDLRTRLADFDPRKLLLGFMIFIMTAALFLSLSRGGIVAGLLGVFFFFGLSRRYRLLRVRKAFPIFGAAALGLAVFLIYLGPRPLLQRFQSVVTGETEQDVRLELWRDAGRIYRDFPLLGTGLGTFERIYPHYKSFIWKMPYTHAENDYLQAAAELGVWGWVSLAGLLLTFFLMILFWNPPPREGARTPLSRSRAVCWEISNRALVAGCSAGVLALGLQSMVSFNFSIPANALLFTVFLALTVGRVCPRESKRSVEASSQRSI